MRSSIDKNFHFVNLKLTYNGNKLEDEVQKAKDQLYKVTIYIAPGLIQCKVPGNCPKLSWW